MAALAALAIGLLILHQVGWRIVGAVLRLAARWAGPLATSRSFVRDHPVTAAFAARFPRTHAFLAERFRTVRFTGLPLTLLAAAALYSAALFGGLIDELFEAEGLIETDLMADRLVSGWRTEAGFEFFLWITELGSGPSFVAIGLVATMFLLIDRRPALVPALWTTLIGAQATTWIGKYAIDRARPEFLDVAIATAPSFPSGHATAAMAVYGFLSYIAVRRVASRRARFEAVYWAGALIFLIGFSRIYLRLHFLSDVLSGFLVGVFWLLVGVAVAEWPRKAGAAR